MKPKGAVRRQRKQYAISWFMLSFWLIIFVIFTLLPVLCSVVLSFTDYNMLQKPDWVGMDNYLRMLLEDEVFITAFKNTMIFAIITGPLGYILSFLVAWLINDLSDGTRTVFTLLFYSPTLAGNVYFVWLYIFSGDSYGLINGALLRLGILNEPIQWLTDPKYNMAAVIVVILWMSMGSGFLAFVAGLKQMNRTLFEAGALDGVRNRWQELYYITLPQMAPQLLIGAVLSISGAFAVGNQCSALTGFPSTDYSTHTLVLHILDFGYNRLEMGYASAVAVVLFLIMLVSWNAINRALSRLNGD